MRNTHRHFTLARCAADHLSCADFAAVLNVHMVPPLCDKSYYFEISGEILGRISDFQKSVSELWCAMSADPQTESC